ncbi:MAG: hypothetical protein IIW63_01960 [Clostridia bacterium]|nr:hypothetical protein [Clostridia bacterium]
MKKQKQENLKANSIRLAPSVWEDCERRAERMGLKSKNEFIRDAITFYTEWLDSPATQKFMTPALESVIGAKVRDSEERLARLLFKLAVDQNFLAHIVGNTYEYDEGVLGDFRIQSLREVKETNGTLTAKDILRGEK